MSETARLAPCGEQAGGVRCATVEGPDRSDRTAGVRRPAPAGRAAVWLIHAYQVARVGHISPCRFTPSCSEYAARAVADHGTRHGGALIVRRLLRCRPGGPFGYDPVPPVSE